MSGGLNVLRPFKAFNPFQNQGFGKTIDQQIAALFARDVAVIGDSRVYDSEYVWKNVSFPSGTEGLALSVGFCTGQGITVDSPSGGLLEYRASDAHMRWTAPGDSPGTWTAISLGWMNFESGTEGKGVRIGVRSIATLPDSDKSFPVNVTGVTQVAWNAFGFSPRAFNYLRWLNRSPKHLGLGGNTTSQVVEQLAWLQSESSGAGVDIIHLGTNDVAQLVDLVTITSNLTTIFDARRQLGRRLVLLGENARWGDSASTPLTNTQQSTLAGVNAFISSYAAQHGEIFVDVFALTVDPGFADSRPLPGVLRDSVHYSALGAQLVGEAVANAIAAKTNRGPRRAEGSPGNLFSLGYMAGSSGTAGAGASGSVPTGWTVSRASGSDVSAECDVVDRSDGTLGRWMQLDVTATTGGQILQASVSTSSLATLGLSAGEDIYIEAEMEISDVSGGLVECDAFVTFVGTSPLASLRCQRVVGTDQRQAAESSVRRSPTMKIPAGTTGIRFYLWVRTQGATSARVRLASCAIARGA